MRHVMSTCQHVSLSYRDLIRLMRYVSAGQGTYARYRRPGIPASHPIGTGEACPHVPAHGATCARDAPPPATRGNGRPATAGALGEASGPYARHPIGTIAGMATRPAGLTVVRHPIGAASHPAGTVPRSTRMTIRRLKTKISMFSNYRRYLIEIPNSRRVSPSA